MSVTLGLLNKIHDWVTNKKSSGMTKAANDCAMMSQCLLMLQAMVGGDDELYYKHIIQFIYVTQTNHKRFYLHTKEI